MRHIDGEIKLPKEKIMQVPIADFKKYICGEAYEKDEFVYAKHIAQDLWVKAKIENPEEAPKNNNLLDKEIAEIRKYLEMTEKSIKQKIADMEARHKQEKKNLNAEIENKVKLLHSLIGEIKKNGS